MRRDSTPHTSTPGTAPRVGFAAPRAVPNPVGGPGPLGGA